VRIIATAEAQGFGPAAQLVSILNPFIEQGIKVDFFGSGTCYEYFNNEFENVKDLDISEHYDEAFFLLKNYDALVTVMDSKAALLAKHLGLRVVYIDLIFSLYDLEDYDYEKKANNIIKDKEKVKMVVENNYYSYNKDFMRDRAYRSALSHILSDKAFFIEFIPCNNETKTFLRKANSEVIGPVLDSLLFRMNNIISEKTKILVSLGGLQKQNKYSILIEKVFELLKGDLDIKIASSNINLHSSNKLLSKQEYFSELSSSNIIIATSGFSTVYEALYLGKIVLLLPPQNVGQIKFVDYLKQNLSSEQIFSWDDFFKREEDLWLYMKNIEEKMIDDNLINSLSSEISNMFNKINTDQELQNRILQKQQRFLKRMDLSDGSIIREYLNTMIK